MWSPRDWRWRGSTGAGLFEPGLYNLKGELLLLQGASNAPEAEGCLRQAIQIAQGQSNKLAELYATMSLARLLERRGKRDEARAMLAEIYGWFSDGFDTAAATRRGPARPTERIARPLQFRGCAVRVSLYQRLSSLAPIE